MSLGMEAALGPGDFVLDGDPAPYKGAETPPQKKNNFFSGPCLMRPNDWMDEAGTWM